MSYKQRELTVSFTLANGTFDGDVGDTLTVKGFKCEAAISAFGGATGTILELSLWGLSLDNMAKLTTNAQKIIASEQNAIRVYAGDDRVFSGSITSARINLNQMPDAPIEITAAAAGRERLIPCEPTSIRGDVDVADMIRALAFKVGLKFINVDVKATHSNPYFEGNAVAQILKIAAAHKITANIDFGTVTIYTGKTPSDSVVPYISPATGLIGYPIFYDQGINFRCIYSSSLKLNTKIILETNLPHASGEWIVQAGTTHYLSCKVPGGLWETFVVAAPGFLINGSDNVNQAES
ncbi:baseplate hub protein [Klebsiella aerogenes]|jgi:hypothetical protein|uniref:baseplate hub protein n=1 Tax=Klebsiella aerogenes TaxID=548 RepID=UPI000452345E|nr:hypothetical protein [Klebsiella aerogenes]ELV3607192.1 hypothetical protein [Klebsiella oxytoca]DAV34410.1 MAG TPA: tail protein [Caudoviricetes sp.]AML34683.1 Hypothetical protein EAG7_00937 [Klebsiella aerogenes]ATY08438.1 hypothetical protein AM336_23995 [Klebsiella aerogenes]AXY31450.1 hypothetical protein CEQ05_25365 [Klebsiella aerogenes]